jgi:hypothetical protein
MPGLAHRLEPTAHERGALPFTHALITTGGNDALNEEQA